MSAGWAWEISQAEVSFDPTPRWWYPVASKFVWQLWTRRVDKTPQTYTLSKQIFAERSRMVVPRDNRNRNKKSWVPFHPCTKVSSTSHFAKVSLRQSITFRGLKNIRHWPSYALAKGHVKVTLVWRGATFSIRNTRMEKR